jgi:antitoxin HigA-1
MALRRLTRDRRLSSEEVEEYREVREQVAKELPDLIARHEERMAPSEHRLPKHLPPPHPGEMLLEEFLKPLGISQSAFAIRLGVSFPRLNQIVRGKRSITPDTALRLARVLGMSADFWLGLQQDWDLWHAMHSKEAAEIDRLEPLRRQAKR